MNHLRLLEDDERPIKVSNSEIQAYKSCRRRWWLTYYRELGIKRYEEAPAGPRQLGTKIHAALQGYYQEGLDMIEMITELYQHDIEWYTEQEQPAKVLELRKEFDLAHAMVTGYEDWVEESGVDAHLELVATESVVEIPLAAHSALAPGLERYVLRGKLDARFMRTYDEKRLFLDHKTVQEFTTPQKLLPIDEQMLFYHMLEILDAEMKGQNVHVDGALYNMIRKVKRTATAKPPFYLRVEQRHNKEQIISIWLRTITIIREINATRIALDSGVDHRAVCPPRPSRDCTWQCDFYRACPMFDDGSNVEGMLAEHYERRDPHERYTEPEQENVL